MSIEAPFLSFPVLMTDRLILRKVTLSDVEALYSIKSDRDLTAKYGIYPHDSKEITRKWIEMILKDYEEHKTLFWCITLRDSDVPIGSFTLWNIDLSSYRAELGYELNRMYWRKGIMYESLSALLEWAFVKMGLNRVEACPLSGNTPSIGILLKLGFGYEGSLKERIFFDGRFEDQLYYGMLKKDWYGDIENRNRVD